MTRLFKTAALLLVLASSSFAVDLVPLITDPNANMGPLFDDTTIFADEPAFFADDTALDGGNNIAVFTLDGTPMGHGGGFTLAVSNGENGIDTTEAGANVDAPNTHPVNSTIAALNPSGRLESGNAIRLSAWMRQDPNNPINATPQIEPVLKIELWKEAFGSVADFSSAPFASFGDRIWDTDQNAGHPQWMGNQSEASWIDLDNDGQTSFERPVAQALVTDEWRLVETTLVIDDDPLSDGLGWGIGDESFFVEDVEEVRGVLFFGDFEETDLNDAGSFWVDNLHFEIFATEAELLNTPNANPLPTDEGGGGLVCDFNGDNACDSADLDLLYGQFGGNDTSFDVNTDESVDASDIAAWLEAASDPANTHLDGERTFLLGDVNLSGSVDSTDLGLLLNNFGDTAGLNFGSGNLNGDANVDSTDLGLLLNNFGATSASASAVPEPGTLGMLAFALLVGLGVIRSRS